MLTRAGTYVDRLWGLFVLAWVSFTLWTVLVFHWEPIGRLDRYCYEIAAWGASSEAWIAWMHRVTLLGDDRWLCVLCGVLGLYLIIIKRRPAAALWLFSSLWVGIWLTWMLKALCARPRPDGFVVSLTVPNYAFPSGHAFNGVFFYGMALWLLRRMGVRWCATGWALTVTSAIMVWIGISRVALGVHWASDVVGGALWAVLWGVVNVMWMERVGVLEGKWVRSLP